MPPMARAPALDFVEAPTHEQISTAIAANTLLATLVQSGGRKCNHVIRGSPEKLSAIPRRWQKAGVDYPSVGTLRRAPKSTKDSGVVLVLL